MQNSGSGEDGTMWSIVDRYAGNRKLSDEKTQNVEEQLPLTQGFRERSDCTAPRVGARGKLKLSLCLNVEELPGKRSDTSGASSTVSRRFVK
jgi:hypothetical protein